MTELSSLVASVTIKELGFFFFLRIAVAVSSFALGSAPDGSTSWSLARSLACEKSGSPDILRPVTQCVMVGRTVKLARDERREKRVN